MGILSLFISGVKLLLRFEAKVPMKRNFFIILFERAFKMIKNALYSETAANKLLFCLHVN